MRIHVDTDFAGDPDDACALAMLLGWNGVDVVGVTTVADPDGRRAGYVRRLLALAGRQEVTVAIGAGSSLTTGQPMGTIPDHNRYWSGDPVSVPEKSTVSSADLMKRNLAAGATVVAIGPQTNLALLELESPGALAGVPVVAMGGWFGPVADDLPDLGPASDWNVQCDTRAAAIVAATAKLTLVPLSTTVGVHLTRRDLPRLYAAGPVGQLLARQAVAYCDDERKSALASAHLGLPADLLNFHHDPLACAVAAGWPGVLRQPVPLSASTDGAILSYTQSGSGRPVDVVTAVDGPMFTSAWLRAIERLGDSDVIPRLL
ncbi:MAG: nucleoside hydrolase [Nocardioidaceae bacterium]|nr:nucleoside hydrolase [Nocardioidaceae bacterium]